jgi:SEC-C motif
MSAIGRNDPCLCGSGKKYKRCCLGKGAPAPGAWTAGELDTSATTGAGSMSRCYREALDD